MDIIQQYAQAGFALFPLNGKKPAQEGNWKLTLVDPSLSRIDFLGNYGVVAGSRLILDIDCKKGAPGKISFKKLTTDMGLEKGWEANTFVVRTGTGGFHVYLEMPVVMKIKKHHKDYPGVEFLHGPFYVVGPESIHPDTELPYSVAFGAPGALLDVPKALLELLGQPETEILGPRPEPGFVDDDPLNIERFIEILKDIPAPSVGSRRDTIYIAACRGRDLGISKATCLNTLKESFVPEKILPALEDGEVEHTVNSAYRYAKQKMGSLNVGAIFKTAEVGEPIDFGKIAYDTGAKGNISKTLNNAVNYLITLPEISEAFRFNVFSGMIEINSNAPWYKERGAKGPNVCDEDITMLKYFLAKTVKIEFSPLVVLEAITVVAHKRHYHPVRNYLNDLKWDGKTG
jgi:hypothetical protein